MKGKGVQRIAQTLDARIQGITQRPSPFDLGMIDGDGSLRLDHFRVPLPSGEYLVSSWTVNMMLPLLSRIVLAASPVDADGNNTESTVTTRMRLDFQAGDDENEIPEVSLEFAPALKQGDRVLVVWVGSDPVVLSKVVSSNA